MNKEKVKILIETLTDLPFYQWENIKREIDRCYELERNKNVPNEQLGTLTLFLNQWCDNLSKHNI